MPSQYLLAVPLEAPPYLYLLQQTWMSSVVSFKKRPALPLNSSLTLTEWTRYCVLFRTFIYSCLPCVPFKSQSRYWSRTSKSISQLQKWRATKKQELTNIMCRRLRASHSCQEVALSCNLPTLELSLRKVSRTQACLAINQIVRHKPAGHSGKNSLEGEVEADEAERIMRWTRYAFDVMIFTKCIEFSGSVLIFCI